MLSQGSFPLCLLGFVNPSIYKIHWTHLLRHTRDSDSGLETRPYSKSHRKSSTVQSLWTPTHLDAQIKMGMRRFLILVNQIQSGDQGYN